MSTNQNPQGVSRQELSELGVSSTTGLSWRGPLELYGCFAELARQAFSESGFSSRKWNQDETKSDVYITPEYLWDDLHVEKRPAILVRLAEIRCTPYSSTFSEPGGMGINIRGEHGVEHKFADVKSGFVTWDVIAETRGEALSILGDLAKFLNVFQSRIAEDLCMKTFYVTQISPLSVVKEARERLRVSVSAEFSYEYSWSLVEEAPKAKIDVEINSGI